MEDIDATINLNRQNYVSILNSRESMLNLSIVAGDESKYFQF